MTVMQRSIKHWLVIKAARQLRQEIEKAGLDDLKTLAEAGRSIVGTYLQECSPQEKAQHRRDLNTLLQVGVTPDMLLDEIARQMPQLAPIMEGKEAYKQSETEQLKRFLAEEQ